MTSSEIIQGAHLKWDTLYNSNPHIRTSLARTIYTCNYFSFLIQIFVIKLFFVFILKSRKAQNLKIFLFKLYFKFLVLLPL